MPQALRKEKNLKIKAVVLMRDNRLDKERKISILAMNF
jgi:hypothetical protein